MRRLTRTESYFTSDGPLNYTFIRVFASLASIAGIILTGFSGASFSSLGPLQSYAEISDGAGLSGFQGLVLGIYMVLAGAVVVWLGAVGSFWGAHFSKRPIIIFFCIVVTIGAVISLVGSILGTSARSKMYSGLCVEDGCYPGDGSHNQATEDMVNVLQATFDECCIPRAREYDLVQGNLTEKLGYADIELWETRVQQQAFGPCVDSDPFSSTCPGVTPAILDDLGEVFATLKEKLCTCAPDASNYNKAIQAIRNKNSCSKFDGYSITIDASVGIPTQSAGLLSAIVPQYSDYFSLHEEDRNGFKALLHGNPGPDWEKNLGGGFGCGLMITKGYQYYAYLYVQENFKAVFNAGIACSIIALISVLLTIAYIFVARSDDDLDDYEYDSYGVAMAKPIINIRAKPQTQPQSPSQLTAAPPPAKPVSSKSGLKKEQLEDQLVAFYERHEPSKLDDGKVDPGVVNFGLTKGLKALNAKLKSKYGVDLNSDDSFSESGSHVSELAETITRRDVDDII